MNYAVRIAGCCICLLVILLTWADAFAQEPGSPAAVDLGRLRELVGYLNDPSYARREAAARELTELGDAARAVLTEALRDPYPETRLAARRILADISRDDFEKALAALLADESGSVEHRLPMWSEYREAIGFDQTARQMYVDMLRAESSLLTEIAARPRTSGGFFYNRCQELRRDSNDQGREVPGSSIAALLFVAADPRVPISSSANSQLSSFCHHESVRTTLSEDAAPSIMRTLVGRWIADGRGGNYALRLAMQYNLPEGLDAAMKMLAGDEPAYYQQYAVLAIAKLGDLDQAPLLDRLMLDTTVCATHRADMTTYTAQLRDIALVAAIHLHGKDPKDFGFDRLRTSSQYLYSPYSLGFASDEARQAANAKWAEAQAAEAKPKTESPED